MRLFRRKRIKKPVNQITEVMYMLLTRKSINVRQMMFDTGILNLTARISDIRIKYGVDIVCEKQIVKNKFGRKISFGKWTLNNREKLIIIYDEIC